MEKILAMANEIGLMIKKTDEYKTFEKARAALNGSGDTSKLFEEYIVAREMMALKKQQGDIIESFEIEKLKGLEEKINQDHVISEFIRAQDDYARLILEIQKSISDE